jgi:putative DNA primase/helicase
MRSGKEATMKGDNPTMQSALQLAEDGFRVIVLHGLIREGDGWACTCGNGCGRSRGKHPRLPGWQKSPKPSPEAVRGWFDNWPSSNIGVATGDGLVVIDVDQHGVNGQASLADLEHTLGRLPPTRTAITGGGGRHLYYLCERKLKSSAGKLAPGIDIRAEGGQVVAPYSRHLSGEVYRWDEESPSYLVELPQAWADAIEKSERGRQAPAPRADRTGPKVDMASWLESWIATYLSGKLLGPFPYEDGRKWVFALCPWNADHTNRSAFIIQRGDGTIQAGCHHAGCAGHDWKGLREMFEGPRKPRKTRDPGDPPPDDIPPPDDGDAPPERPANEKKTEETPGTDLASARVLYDLHADEVHWVEHWGRWYGWTGKVWQSDETGKVRRLAEHAINEIKRRKASIGQDLDEAKKANADMEVINRLKRDYAVACKWDERVSNRSGFMAMLEMLKHQEGIALRTEDVDQDPMLFNVLNGTLDLRTGKLRPHSKDDLITRLVALEYDPDAKCPLWEGFIETIMGGKPELISYLRRVVGLCLTGSVEEQVCFFLHGSGSNGKSTFLDILLKLVGGYGKPVDSELVMATHGEQHPTNIANLLGMRVVTTIETAEHRRLAEAKLKWITGSDKLSARFMREDFFDFIPTHKLLIAGNHKPVVRGVDLAIWRRIHLVPFLVTIMNPDKKFGLRLLAELPGILAWAVRGCLEWQEQGLNPPAEVLEATAEYRREMDILSQFIEDRCVEGRQYRAEASLLYKAYREWTEAAGEYTESAKTFGQRLTERGIGADKGSKGTRYRTGIGIRETTFEGNSSRSRYDDIF